MTFRAWELIIIIIQYVYSAMESEDTEALGIRTRTWNERQLNEEMYF